MDLREIPQGDWARHPWEVSRLQFFARILEGVVGAHRVLDAGAGDGWFSANARNALPAGAEVICWDSQYSPEQLIQFNQRAAGQRFTAELPAGPFDLLILLDVLEHVEDDKSFLRRLVERLELGATALISVPAWQGLFTSHDRYLRHYRRYSPDEAARVIQTAGLEVCSSGGLFHGLLLARGLAWAGEQLRANPDDRESTHDLGWRHGPLLTRATHTALRLDNRLSHAFARRGLQVPGLSWWALCRRSS
jgi:SAM-dependent methyltransferase